MRETTVRRDAIAAIVADADSIEKIKSRMGSEAVPTSFHEYKDFSLEELSKLQDSLDHKIEFQDSNDYFLLYTRDLAGRGVALYELAVYGGIFLGRNDFNAKPQELDRVKQFVGNFFLAAHRRYDALQYIDYEPNCGLRAIIDDNLFGEKKAIIGRPSEFFKHYTPPPGERGPPTFGTYPSLPDPFMIMH